MNKISLARFFAAASLVLVSIRVSASSSTMSPEIQALQTQIDLEKQRNALQVDLITSQKALIEAQKSAIDSQTGLLGSQKALTEALYPQISGGKTGAITFDASVNFGPLAQPDAISALKSLVETICKDTRDSGASSVVIVTDSDLKLISQARWINLQLSGLREAYKDLSMMEPSGGATPNAVTPSLALYGVASALKEVASFAQLFRSDTTVYSSSVKVDQDLLNAAIAGCLKGPGANVAVHLSKTLLVNSLTNPDTSGILDSLKALRSQRAKADTTLYDLAGKADDGSKRRAARITALNTSMDTVINNLFATSEKSPEPLFVGVLAGEALQQKISSGSLMLQAVLSNAAASGIKRSSIWRSDRLYSWTTVTINYSLFDSSGSVLKAGAVQNSPEGRKIELTP